MDGNKLILIAHPIEKPNITRTFIYQLRLRLRTLSIVSAPNLELLSPEHSQNSNQSYSVVTPCYGAGPRRGTPLLISLLVA